MTNKVILRGREGRTAASFPQDSKQSADAFHFGLLFFLLSVCVSAILRRPESAIAAPRAALPRTCCLEVESSCAPALASWPHSTDPADVPYRRKPLQCAPRPVLERVKRDAPGRTPAMEMVRWRSPL